MVSDSSGPAARPHRLWWAVLLGGLALLLTALVVAMLSRTPADFGAAASSATERVVATAGPTGPDEPPAPAPEGPAAPTATGTTGPVPLVPAEARRPAALPERPRASAPVGLQLPDVDVDVDVVPVGVREDGQMEIPESGFDVGWYRYGAAPGQGEGSTVLASHVDTLAEGRGVLARLTELRRGDVVSVALADGTAVDYRVTGRRTVPKAGLDTQALFDRSGPERLQLVTCGGPWQPERSSYRDNVIVTAEPVSASS